MKKPYTLTVFVENSPGVLHRLTVLFTRRRTNIDSLTVSETEQPHLSRFTIVVRLEEQLVPTVIRQIRRIIEVQQAYASEDEDLLFREIAFFKVSAGSPELRLQIEELSRRHSAKIALIEPGFVVIEKTGSESEIQSLYLLFEPFGIQEFIRSGRIAIRKHALQNEIGITLNTEARKEQPITDAI